MCGSSLVSVWLLSGCVLVLVSVQAHGWPLIRHFSFFGVSYRLAASVLPSIGCSWNQKQLIFSMILALNYPTSKNTK